MALRHAFVKRGVSVRGEGRKATGVVKCIIMILPVNFNPLPVSNTPDETGGRGL